jgi:hypothetical protein
MKDPRNRGSGNFKIVKPTLNNKHVLIRIQTEPKY